MPTAWWSALLGPLATGLPDRSAATDASRDPSVLDRRWSEGPGQLTGRADGPPLPGPPSLVRRVDALGRALRGLGTGPFDAIGALALRATTHGITRNGGTSCGGASHLLRAADGWIALTVARDDDRALLPALLEDDAAIDAVGAHLEELVRSRPASALVDRGALLGLPVARLGETRSPTSAEPAVAARRVGRGRPVDRVARVVDLSSLWAGPLCGRLLAGAGADVLKVESTERPDGARSGPAAFFDALDGGKRHRSIPFTTDEGRAELAGLLHDADVVIEASRPRALEQLGIDREAMVREHGVSVWLTITGHGTGPGVRDRIAFGDDAAVAGGLVAWDGEHPVFCADAIADPLTGMTAALATLLALRAGGGWCLDVPLARVAAAFAGDDA